MLQREEKASDMTGFALCGSLALTQYLGPDTVAERVKLLPKEFRCWFHAGLCLWWILQSAGMTCSTYAQHLKELQCVRILCRLGILGAVPTWLAMRSIPALRLAIVISNGYLCRLQP